MHSVQVCLNEVWVKDWSTGDKVIRPVPQPQRKGY